MCRVAGRLRSLASETAVPCRGCCAILASAYHSSPSSSAASAAVRAVFFTGAESPKLREQAVVELHEDPSTTVMFLSDAGGVGLNLQRAASCCINLELPWNPAVLEQRIGRIYRLGQTLPIDVYNLVTEEGIEARIASLLAHKKAVFSTLFDGTTDQVVFDGQSSFLEGVKKLVDPVPLPVGAALEDANEDPLPSSAPAEDIAPAALGGEESTAPDPAASGARVVAPPPAMERQPAELAAAPARSESAEPSGAPPFSITRLPDGGLRIEATPALAEPLARLLEALARTLREAVPLPSQSAAPNGAADAPVECGT
jgi:hypothetical protein